MQPPLLCLLLGYPPPPSCCGRPLCIAPKICSSSEFKIRGNKSHMGIAGNIIINALFHWVIKKCDIGCEIWRNLAPHAWLYRVLKKNPVFEFSRLLSSHWPGQLMHSPSTLTEHVSLNMAGFFFHPCKMHWCMWFCFTVLHIIFSSLAIWA